MSIDLTAKTDAIVPIVKQLNIALLTDRKSDSRLSLGNEETNSTAAFWFFGEGGNFIFFISERLSMANLYGRANMDEGVEV